MKLRLMLQHLSATKPTDDFLGSDIFIRAICLYKTLGKASKLICWYSMQFCHLNLICVTGCTLDIFENIKVLTRKRVFTYGTKRFNSVQISLLCCSRFVNPDNNLKHVTLCGLWGIIWFLYINISFSLIFLIYFHVIQCKIECVFRVFLRWWYLLMFLDVWQKQLKTEISNEFLSWLVFMLRRIVF